MKLLHYSCQSPLAVPSPLPVGSISRLNSLHVSSSFWSQWCDPCLAAPLYRYRQLNVPALQTLPASTACLLLCTTPFCSFFFLQTWASFSINSLQRRRCLFFFVFISLEYSSFLTFVVSRFHVDMTFFYLHSWVFASPQDLILFVFFLHLISTS